MSSAFYEPYRDWDPWIEWSEQKERDKSIQRNNRTLAVKKQIVRAFKKKGIKEKKQKKIKRKKAAAAYGKF